MPSTYTTNLRFELQATGENKSSWGQKANTDFELIEEAICGKLDVPVPDANVTLTALQGASDQSRPMFLKFTGILTANRTITFPSRSKLYIINNATTGGFSLILTVGASTYTLMNNQQKLVYTDGATVWTNDNLATLSSATGRWGIPAAISATGFMEIGRYIDFHNANVEGADFAVRLDTGNTTTDLYITPSTPPATPGAKIWHASNDGAGSGLDADMVDGMHAADIGFQPGTIMIFVQTAAPIGWTKLTTHNDKALRIVSGAVGSGGTLAFSAATVGNTTLTLAQTPAHSHTQQGYFNTGTVSANHEHYVSGSTTHMGAHNHPMNMTVGNGGTGAGVEVSDAHANEFGTGRISTGGGGDHSHTIGFWSGQISANHYHGVTIGGETTSIGSGGAHSHSLALQYVDVIMAVKN